MEGKFIIFVVFVSVLSSSFAQYSPNDCINPTGLEIDLGLIKHGRDISIEGLKETFGRLFSLMEYELAQHTFGGQTEAERAYKLETIANVTNTAIMIGIPPTLNAIKVIHPYFDVETVTAHAYVALTTFNGLIIEGIKLGKLECYEDAKSALEVLVPQITEVGNALSNGVLGGIVGELTFSDESATVVECTKNNVRSNILTAFDICVKALDIFLVQVFEGTKENYANCLKQIRAHAQQAMDHVIAEVIGKFALTENLYISAYLEKVGILPGIFALQAANVNIGKAESVDSQVPTRFYIHQDL